MKFSKRNNPNKRRRKMRERLSANYKFEKDEMFWSFYSECKSEKERDLLMKAYNITQK